MVKLFWASKSFLYYVQVNYYIGKGAFEGKYIFLSVFWNSGRKRDYAFDMLEMAVKIVAQVSTWEREC